MIFKNGFILVSYFLVVSSVKRKALCPDLKTKQIYQADNTRFYIITSYNNLLSARIFCKAFNLRLARIHGPSEEFYLRTKIKEILKPTVERMQFWTALQMSRNDPRYFTFDGTSIVDYQTVWDMNTTFGADDNCYAMSYSFKTTNSYMTQANCNSKYITLCESTIEACKSENLEIGKNIFEGIFPICGGSALWTWEAHGFDQSKQFCEKYGAKLLSYDNNKNFVEQCIPKILKTFWPDTSLTSIWMDIKQQNLKKSENGIGLGVGLALGKRDTSSQNYKNSSFVSEDGRGLRLGLGNDGLGLGLGVNAGGSIVSSLKCKFAQYSPSTLRVASAFCSSPAVTICEFPGKKIDNCNLKELIPWNGGFYRSLFKVNCSQAFAICKKNGLKLSDASGQDQIKNQYDLDEDFFLDFEEATQKCYLYEKRNGVIEKVVESSSSKVNFFICQTKDGKQKTTPAPIVAGPPRLARPRIGSPAVDWDKCRVGCQYGATAGVKQFKKQWLMNDTMIDFSRFYIFSPDKLTYLQAMRRCYDMNTELWTIESKDIVERFEAVIAEVHPFNFWETEDFNKENRTFWTSALKFSGDSNQYFWMSSGRFLNFNMLPQNSKIDNKPKAIAIHKGRWIEADIHEENHYICQRRSHCG